VIGADGGIRTHIPVRETVWKTDVSASSTTPAQLRGGEHPKMLPLAVFGNWWWASNSYIVPHRP
jgi:hypothetical protein